MHANLQICNDFALVVSKQQPHSAAMGDVVVWWKTEGATSPKTIRAPPGSFWANVKKEIWKGLGPEAPRPAVICIHVRHCFLRSLSDRSLLLTLLGFTNCLSLSLLLFLPAAQAFWCYGRGC